MTTHPTRPDDGQRDGVLTSGRSQSPHETGPARFQRFPAQTSRPPLGSSVASALALLVLVVGVPVGLLWLGGVPRIPTSLPTQADLTGTIGTEVLLAVLVWVVWIAWLQFTVCVVVELRSALSGVGLPARVPLAGPSQRAARTLVASVLLLMTVVGQANAVTMDHGVHSASTPTSAVSMLAAGDVGWSGVDGAVATGAQSTAADAVATPAATAAVPVVEQGSTTYLLGDVVLTPEEGLELVGKKVAVVHPPEGRHHDNLWDIAERGLGDGRRYQEIFELNKGRQQPDGHELSLARLIYPEWLLIMPEDAVGVERVTAVVAPAPVAAPVASPVSTPGGVDATSAATSAASTTPATATAGSTVGTDAWGGGLHDVSSESLLGAGLLAAGLVAALDRLRRRRRTTEPSQPAVEVEVALRVGADQDRATRLDRGLRGLASLLQDAGRDLPGAYAAVIDDSTLTVHLAPADARAPAPWRSQDRGRSWALDASSTPEQVRSAPAPFPGLVSLGRDGEGADVLIDLEAAQGPVAVVGDPALALEVVTALAAELTTNSWSDKLRVTGVGLPQQLAALDGVRYRGMTELRDALPALRERRADTLGAGVLTGRLRGSGASAWMPEYLVLGSAPDAEAARELIELSATDQRSPLGVLCAGELPGARWRLEVADDGSLVVGLLNLRVTANRLTGDQVAAIAELLTAEPDPLAEGEAVRSAQVHEPLAERPEPTAPARPVEAADLAAAPVRVHVLGPPRVHASGHLDPERVALSTELVVHLALHPVGVHPTVLAGALWPRGVTAAVRDATIARTRTWLGVDRNGTPHLREHLDGRLHLGPGAVVDWDVVATLLARARSASPAEERRDLAGALRLATGPVLAERPAGRYSWLARVRLERSVRDLLVDAAHRLVILSWGDDDRTGALSAARAGLRIAPTDELLWRDALRAAMATGGSDAVREVASELEQALHGVGIAHMSATTAALLEDLVPGPSAGAHGAPMQA